MLPTRAATRDHAITTPTVGQFADPDNTFTLASTTSSPGGALVGSTVTAQFGQEVDVFMDAEFTVADSYEVTLTAIPANPPHWTIVIGDPPQNQQGKHVHTVTQQDIDNSVDGRVPKTIEIGVVPDTGAADAQLRVVVKGSAATKSHTFTFDLHPTAP